METITSVNNSLIKETAKLKMKKYRDDAKLFLVEGEHLVKEAENAGLLTRVFINERHREKYSHPDAVYVTDEVIRKLSDTVSTIDMVGVCRVMSEKEELGKKLIVLDSVQDPGNLGTIIRTACSFGYDVVASNDCCDVYNEKVIRSTQGSIFHINYLKRDLKPFLSELKREDYSVYGTALKGAKGLKTFEKKDKIALVVGNEGNGVRKEILEMTDENIFIEMEAFESLNVAVASAIIMYYFK